MLLSIAHAEMLSNSARTVERVDPVLLFCNDLYVRAINLGTSLCDCLANNGPTSIYMSFYSFINSGYFSSASSRALLLRGAPNYIFDTLSELTRRCATGNCERRTCPKSLRGGWSRIRTCDPPDASDRIHHWATMPHYTVSLSPLSVSSLLLSLQTGLYSTTGCRFRVCAVFHIIPCRTRLVRKVPGA